MGDLMRIYELEGQVERKDAYIDKLTGDLSITTLERDHAVAVCGELRQKIDAIAADRDQLKALLTRWKEDPDTYPADETLLADTEAAMTGGAI